MERSDGILIAVWACVAGMLFSLAIHSVRDMDTPEAHYFQNVCKWERGVVKDDLCIKGDTVIGRKRGYQFVDFKEVP